jgi:hypothetical protein
MMGRGKHMSCSPSNLQGSVNGCVEGPTYTPYLSLYNPLLYPQTYPQHKVLSIPPSSHTHKHEKNGQYS